MDETKRIADGLTEAQRRKLLEIGYGQPREYSLGVSGFSLLRAKLAFVNELGARHLTDAGHAVRRELESRHD